MAQTLPYSIKPIAASVNSQLVLNAVDMRTIFQSLERDYNYHVQASYTGFTIGRRGERPVYAEGVYRPVMARGKEQCAQYRLRLLKLFLWASKHAPTPEITQYEEWLRAKF